MQCNQRSSTLWTAEAPAKINLFFEVLGQRDDGFHNIVSIALPIQLFDTLAFELTDTPGIPFKCVGNKDIPLDETNLAVRAVKLLQQRYHVPYGASLTLTKRIPSQSGLGGGSSDAAAALRLACRAWNLDVPEPELMTLASELGSDCPLFFFDGPTIGTGRGEQIQPLSDTVLSGRAALWFVLLKPPEGLSTPAVYAECMPIHDGQFRQSDDLIKAIETGNVHAIGQHLFNRLEHPAQKLWTRFGEFKPFLLSLGCLAVQMSGSGTAFFGMCENEEHAREVFESLCRKAAPEHKPFLVRSCCGH